MAVDLGALAARLAAIAPHLGFTVATPGSVTAEMHGDAVRCDIERAVARGARPALAAGLGWLAAVGPALNVVVASFVAAGVRLSPASVVAIAAERSRPPTVLVDSGARSLVDGGPDDPEARRRWAAALCAHVAMTLVVARGVGRVAERFAWGNVVDRVAVIAHLVACRRHVGGVGPDPQFERALRLAAEVRDLGPCRDVALPTEFVVVHGTSSSTFVDKGTCCSIYRLAPGSDRSTGAGYCTTCPLVDRSVRCRRLAAWRSSSTEEI